MRRLRRHRVVPDAHALAPRGLDRREGVALQPHVVNQLLVAATSGEPLLRVKREVCHRIRLKPVRRCDVRREVPHLLAPRALENRHDDWRSLLPGGALRDAALRREEGGASREGGRPEGVGARALPRGDGGCGEACDVVGQAEGGGVVVRVDGDREGVAPGRVGPGIHGITRHAGIFEADGDGGGPRNVGREGEGKGPRFGEGGGRDEEPGVCHLLDDEALEHLGVAVHARGGTRFVRWPDREV
mmetsp:Transcript_8520/g.19693  ORF Transcript_8520/g.19693 Transcript_8520/m.19693 type:complete len:244 (+) Transcript_8520:576-1307(+)